MIDYFLNRRSTKLNHMSEPGPNTQQLQTILTAASRTPDHGKYVPWYFIVFQGEARKKFGDILRAAYQKQNPEAAEAKLDLEAERFLRAPTVIAVISRIKNGKHPQWEQILSAGAVCMNLCHAANVMGFGTNWLTEWAAYDAQIREALQLDARDHIAGFIYIGTATQANEERERPALNNIINYWDEGYAPQKGDMYGLAEQPLPAVGFTPPFE